jgi:hypothetical protein
MTEDRLPRALHYALFAPLLGTRFEFHPAGSGAAAVPLMLVEATQSQTLPQYEQFTLHWDGPPAPMLRQGTHRVTHPAIGEIDVFIVPIARDAGAVRYEAVFSVDRARPCA